jgi:hypothetical protein
MPIWKREEGDGEKRDRYGEGRGEHDVSFFLGKTTTCRRYRTMATERGCEGLWRRA